MTFSGEQLKLQWPLSASKGSPMQLSALLGIRAEDVTLSTPNGTPAPNAFPGTVALLEPLGSDTFVEVTDGTNTITARVEPDRQLAVGDRVVLHFPAEKVHLFDATTQQRINPYTIPSSTP
jgi:multiple sugar transport system ATP-binding protein